MSLTHHAVMLLSVKLLITSQFVHVPRVIPVIHMCCVVQLNLWICVDLILVAGTLCASQVMMSMEQSGQCVPVQEVIMEMPWSDVHQENVKEMQNVDRMSLVITTTVDPSAVDHVVEMLSARH